jgi:uncharacterized protein YbaR (Trm112 family)
MSIDKELLDILVCPESKAKLLLIGETLVSTDEATRRRFRIEEGIPRMLLEDSEQLDRTTWEGLMKEAGWEASS